MHPVIKLLVQRIALGLLLLLAVSAVIFLVSAKYNMATAYIVGLVENGQYGVAIAYSSVLIVFMALGIVLIQFLVGERKLGRRKAIALNSSVSDPISQGASS